MSLFNNFIQIFGRGSKTQLVDSQQASQLLRNVDDMLDESRKMLGGIRERVPTSVYQSMEFQHNQLYLMVVDVKSDVRGRQGNQVFFANTAERDEFYVQIRQLITRCQIHHNDVLSVSRRAYQSNLQSGETASIAPTSFSTSQEDGSNTEWLSIVSESVSENEIDLSIPVDQQFIATVAHVPKSALATEEELQAQLPDDDSYYRILICGNKRKRAVVVDTKPHLISTNYDDEDTKRSQAEILRVGDMLMKSDPKQLEGHQLVESYQGPSFISSFISSWSYNGLPLGGMV
ncbi:hypothetical protein RSOLAG22IIIB_10417 [Rhizoctonia solani]|uniref:Uncharacterized protein n=1 Tax=Rhizoctonia solani TaxID=456999 RepID=A0A0K6G3J8_9AGAM|nr:hypothetical protein RSOLAG22IIIB_10417 [Rhizoctonia solani]